MEPLHKKRKMERKVRPWIAKPILSDEYTSTPKFQKVYIGILRDRRDISKIITQLSSLLPGFRHLKRCFIDKILLSPVDSDTFHSIEDVKSFLMEKNFDISLFESFDTANVPSEAPKTKDQALVAKRAWPVNFHPDLRLESLLDGSFLTNEDLDTIERNMKIVIEAARASDASNEDCSDSTVIVNPKDGKILAIAASRIDEHPLWHSAVLAIDLVASLQGGGAWNLRDETGTKPSNESFAHRDASSTEKQSLEGKAPFCYPPSLSTIPLPCSTFPREVSEGEESGPYLCTGNWVFLKREPCPFCAMALLHSRVARIFYESPNEHFGVLGSKAILHSVPGLNHRYYVWAVSNSCEDSIDVLL